MMYILIEVYLFINMLKASCFVCAILSLGRSMSTGTETMDMWRDKKCRIQNLVLAVIISVSPLLYHILLNTDVICRGVLS